MKKGAVIALIISGLGLCAMVFAFLNNASPYVTVAEAKTAGQTADNLHLAGDILSGTLVSDVANRTVSFKLKDQKGEQVDVVFRGLPPANMGHATYVVAVGGMKGNQFEANKILTKCPSKYESEGPKTKV